MLTRTANTPSHLDQKYTSFSANVGKRFGDHDIKFGWQFLKTKADGLDSNVLTNQLFATIDDYIGFGPVNSGIFLLLNAGAPTPEKSEIHLDNNYNGVFVQDDWKLVKNLTVNLGLRYEKDSDFAADKNFAPRVGVAWAITPETVIKKISDIMEGARADVTAERQTRKRMVAEPQADYSVLSPEQLIAKIKKLEAQMYKHAQDLEFEAAARLRDEVRRIKAIGFSS